MHWIEWECMWVPLPVSLEKEMATHSSILAWRIPMDRGAWWATVHGVAKNWPWLRTSLSLFSQTACLFHYLSLDKNLVLGKQISYLLLFSSVQFSRSVVSNSLRPHELQHSRPPCPSPTPGVHPNPCPSSRRCHPTISSSVVPFSSCPQSFPASGSFQMSQLFVSGGQSIGVSASTSVLPMNTQDQLGGTLLLLYILKSSCISLVNLSWETVSRIK